jgi:hypothetical protein
VPMLLARSSGRRDNLDMPPVRGRPVQHLLRARPEIELEREGAVVSCRRGQHQTLDASIGESDTPAQ